MDHKFLDIERYQNLVNLGIKFKEPMFCWVMEIGSKIKHIMVNTTDLDHLFYVNTYPAFLAEDLCALLPVRIFRFALHIHLKRREIEYSDGSDVLIAFSYGNGVSLLDAVYDALVWTTKHKEEK